MTAAAVDLFAGPGGWDIAAGALGVDVLGVELDAAACETRDAAGLRTLRADVSLLDPLAVALEAFGRRPEGVIGSPPCPTFSAAGGGAGRHLTEILVACLRALADGRDTRSEARGEAFETLRPVAWEAERAKAAKAGREPDRAAADARARRDADMSVLVVEPLRWVLALGPAWVALEQVPEVLPLWEVVAGLLRARGYSVWTGKLEAERYGVPQTRERAVLLARRAGGVQPPVPTHHRYVSDEPRPERSEDLFGCLEPWVSMAEALGWGMTERPSVTVAAKTGATGGRRCLGGGSGAMETLDRAQAEGEWVVNTREFSADRPSWALTEKTRSWVVTDTGNTKGGARPDGLTRPADAPSATITRRADQLERREAIEWPTTRPATTVAGDPRVFPPGHKINGEDVRAGRGGQLRSGNGHTDGEGARAVRVTVEEAAALQTFPAGYPWRGTRTAQFTQVGNAVPPLLALHVLAAVLAIPVPHVEGCHVHSPG